MVAAGDDAADFWGAVWGGGRGKETVWWEQDGLWGGDVVGVAKAELAGAVGAEGEEVEH